MTNKTSALADYESFAPARAAKIELRHDGEELWRERKSMTGFRQKTQHYP